MSDNNIRQGSPPQKDAAAAGQISVRRAAAALPDFKTAEIPPEAGIPPEISDDLKLLAMNKRDVFAKFIIALSQGEHGPKKVKSFALRHTSKDGEPVKLRLHPYERAILEHIVYSSEDEELAIRLGRKASALVVSSTATATASGLLLYYLRDTNQLNKAALEHFQFAQQAERNADPITARTHLVEAFKAQGEAQYADKWANVMKVVAVGGGIATALTAARWNGEQTKPEQKDRMKRWRESYQELNDALIQQAALIDKMSYMNK
jgi:predicted component of type VI protein secretion system